MQIGLPRQNESGETRVALTPPVVEKLIGQGLSVAVESGAGHGAHQSDQQYEQAGATIVPADDNAPPDAIWGQSDLVVTIHPPDEGQISAMKRGAVLVGLLDPIRRRDRIQQCAEQGITALSMEFLPRISRAQAMDVLSSQANIAGYKATLLGADRAPKMMPMMITAAGTIAPAKVFVVGAGVAGLQAIATARRLGAVVEAYDVRSATKEQVQSLGARFIELGNSAPEAETESGYAKEQSEQEQARQREQLAKHLIASDVIVTTAAVFGKAPPMIVDQSVVQRMHPGTVIVDIAADPDHGRGNCELTRSGEIHTTDNGVTIVGTLALPTLLPVHASEVLANNMHALIKLLVPENELTVDMNDEVLKNAAITHDGEIVNDTVKQLGGA